MPDGEGYTFDRCTQSELVPSWSWRMIWIPQQFHRPACIQELKMIQEENISGAQLVDCSLYICSERSVDQTSSSTGDNLAKQPTRPLQPELAATFKRQREISRRPFSQPGL